MRVFRFAAFVSPTVAADAGSVRADVAVPPPPPPPPGRAKADPGLSVALAGAGLILGVMGVWHARQTRRREAR